MPQNVASDLGMHCFLMSKKWVSSLKWANFRNGRRCKIVTVKTEEASLTSHKLNKSLIRQLLLAFSFFFLFEINLESLSITINSENGCFILTWAQLFKALLA